MDEIRKIPPVTRFLCGATLGITVPVYLGMLSIHTIIIVKQLVTKRLEVYILVTEIMYSNSDLQ